MHGNLAIGLSYGWWVDKHNRHHANLNQEDKDQALHHLHDVGRPLRATTAS